MSHLLKEAKQDEAVNEETLIEYTDTMVCIIMLSKHLHSYFI